MPQILLCSGPSWASLLGQSKEWLGTTPGKAVCITGPELNSDEISETLTGIIPDCTVYTAEGLIQRCLEQLQKNNHTKSSLLSKPAVDYLLGTIIRNIPAESQPVPASAAAPRYLNIETQLPGYIRALGEFIYDFRKTHCEELLPALNYFNKGKLSAKERDLIDIHDEYEQLLRERGIFDYRRAVFSLLGLDKTTAPGTEEPSKAEETLILIGFSRLRSLDYKLLGWLVSRFKRSIILTCRNPKASRTTFRIQRAFESFIKELKNSPALEMEEKILTEKVHSPLLPLAELIFADGKINNRLDLSSRVKITRANSRYHEVTLIARTIRKLNQESTPYSRVRVIFPDSEIYLALLLEVFPHYHIPYTLSMGIPLKFYPLAGTIRNLVGQGVNPNPFPLREKIFSSPYVSFSCEVSAEDLNVFLNSIEVEIPDIKKMIETLFPHPHPVELDFTRILELQAKAFQAVKSGEKLKPVQRVVQYLEERYPEKPSIRDREILKILTNYYVLSRAEKALYVWRAEMTPESFCRAVRKLLERFHIEENAARIRLKDNEGLESLIEQDRRVLRSINLALEKLADHFSLLSSPTPSSPGRNREQKFPLLELVRAFSIFMSDPEFSVPLPDKDGVEVLSTSEAPSHFRPFTLIGGLADGEFPAREPFNFLQPKREGEILQGDFTPIGRERQALYQIIASTTDTLYIFFPFSDSGKKLMISPFVAEIEKCLAAPEKQKASEAETLYTRREKIIFAGRNIDRSYEKVIPRLTELKSSGPEYFQHLVQIFRCDGMRAGLNGFNRFDGRFESKPGLKSIREQVGEDFVFDAGKLERYAGCSLRFLFDDLMRLKPDYLVDYHPDKTDRGLLIKRILTDYSEEAASRLKAARKANREAPSGEETAREFYKSGVLPLAPEILPEIAEKALAKMLKEKDDLFSRRFKYGLLMGLKSQDGSDRKRPGLLSSFLEYEKNGPDHLTPYLAKLSFDRGKELRAMGIPIGIDIERVDITSDGRYLIIYNFSISGPEYIQGIRKGLRFKLPLQILALREHIKEKSIKKAVGGAGTYLVKNPRTIKRAGYFALKELQASKASKVSDITPIFSGQRRYGFLPEPNFEDELDNTVKRVGQITGMIHKGRFNPPLCSPKDQTCPNCQFLRICRKDQLRLDKLYTLLDEKQAYKPQRKME